MKKLIQIVCGTAVLMCVLGVGMVSAQNVGSSTASDKIEQARQRLEEKKNLWQDKKEERQAKIDAKKVEFQQKIEAKKLERQQVREEKKVKLEAKRAEKILKLSERIFGIFDKAITKLETISTRIEGKINSFKARGADVSEAEDLFAVAKQNLTSAKTEIASIKAEVNTKIQNKEVGAGEIKAYFQDARELIQNTKKSFMAVMPSLKMSAGTIKNASSTDDQN